LTGNGRGQPIGIFPSGQEMASASAQLHLRLARDPLEPLRKLCVNDHLLSIVLPEWTTMVVERWEC
jgi:hypothetical protein